MDSSNCQWNGTRRYATSLDGNMRIACTLIWTLNAPYISVQGGSSYHMFTDMICCARRAVSFRSQSASSFARRAVVSNRYHPKNMTYSSRSCRSYQWIPRRGLSATKDLDHQMVEVGDSRSCGSYQWMRKDLSEPGDLEHQMVWSRDSDIPQVLLVTRSVCVFHMKPMFFLFICTPIDIQHV